MRLALDFLPEAFLDAENAVAYYDECLSGLGARFRLELETLCTRILQNPSLWRVRTGGFQRANFSAFPYYVAFVIRSDQMLVLAVGHSSRHPDFWRNRPK